MNLALMKQARLKISDFFFDILYIIYSKISENLILYLTSYIYIHLFSLKKVQVISSISIGFENSDSEKFSNNFLNSTSNRKNDDTENHSKSTEQM